MYDAVNNVCMMLEIQCIVYYNMIIFTVVCYDQNASAAEEHCRTRSGHNTNFMEDHCVRFAWPDVVGLGCSELKANFGSDIIDHQPSLIKSDQKRL